MQASMASEHRHGGDGSVSARAVSYGTQLVAQCPGAAAETIALSAPAAEPGHRKARRQWKARRAHG
jgi:hypothetical protein